MIEMLSPGLLTTVQDEGRWGHQHRGVPVGGPMDPFAHRRANLLAGNDVRAATLEVTLVGPRLRLHAAAVVTCCGGVVDLRADGTPLDGEGPHHLAAGTELAVGRVRRGARVYLGIAGGVEVPVVLGSRSTHLPSAMGGLSGRALRRGDRLAIGPMVQPAAPPGPLPRVALPDAVTVLRVLPGPEAGDFASLARARFLEAEYCLHQDSNRMGYRLDGPSLSAPAADRPSSVVAMGTVQVPGIGAPILLMADRQTTGGYPRLAQVIAADLGLAGQLKPGDRVRFANCTRDEAWRALRDRAGLS